MPFWLYPIASVLAVSLVSLVGLAVVPLPDHSLRHVVSILVSLAVGCLLGDAFLHLLPDAYRHAPSPEIAALTVLAGMLLFFALEKLLLVKHHRGTGQIRPFGYMNLIADGIHNFLDGLAIGAAYLSGIDVGLATTLAVLLHELPQELGDFGILLDAGFSRSRALLLNFLSATLAISGTVVVLAIGVRLQAVAQAILPLTAGGFLYIAAADMVPELQRDLHPGRSIVQGVAILVGIALMWVLTWLE